MQSTAAVGDVADELNEKSATVLIKHTATLYPFILQKIIGSERITYLVHGSPGSSCFVCSIIALLINQVAKIPGPYRVFLQNTVKYNKTRM